MGHETIDVVARIRLLTPEEGGRSAPLVAGSSYRPVHNFWGTDVDKKGYATGFIDLPPGKDVYPGDEVTAKVAFIYWDLLLPELRVGRRWQFQDGSHVVGEATIIDML